MATGEELVTNGDGTSMSGWTGSTGYSVVSGTLKCDGVTTAPSLRQPIGVVQGKTYIVRFTQSGRTSGNCYLVLGGAQPAGTPNLIGEQTYQFVLTCTNSSGTIGFETPSGTFNGSFDNISVRELPAIGTATLFQDSAGTTPVTAVEQSVGLMLDKSKGLVLGSELATPLTTSNWYVSGADGTHIVTFSSGTLRYQSDTTSPQLTVGCNALAVAIPAGTYELTVVVSNYVSGGVKVFENSGASGFLTANALGTFKARITVLANASLNITRATTNVDLTISSVSLKLLAGNHATQPTAINRPVLSARVNLLTKSEQFDDVYWVKSRCSITQTASSSPIGTLTACKVTEDTQNGSHAVVGGNAAIVSGVAYTYSVYAKAAERSHIRLTLPQSLFGGVATDSGARFNLSNGTLEGSADANVTASIQSAGNGWYRCSITMAATVTGTLTLARIYVSTQSGISYLGDGTSGLYIWGAQLIATNSLPSNQYQRVTTATDYDTVGFKHYLKFNGTNSGMSTGSINFTGTDKMMVCAGVRKLSDAIDQATIVELGTNSSSTAGSFALQCSPAFTGRYRMQLFGSSRGVRDTLLNTFAAPNTSVLTMLSDIAQSTISQELIARANGAVLSMDNVLSPAGTGNYGNYPLYIGARAGTSLFFNGNIHGLIVAGTAATPAQIAAAERIINDDTGAY
jgi:hypothetical protein